MNNINRIQSREKSRHWKKKYANVTARLINYPKETAFNQQFDF